MPLTFKAMTLLIRTLLVLAALAYGAMPLTGMAAMMPEGASVIAEPAADTHATHGHVMQSEMTMAADSGQADGDCPHPGKTDRTPHCAACLTLPADLRIADAGSPPRAAEASAIIVAFSSWPTAPLDPPPRV